MHVSLFEFSICVAKMHTIACGRHLLVFSFPVYSITFKFTKCIKENRRLMVYMSSFKLRLAHVLPIGLYAIVLRHLTSEGWDLFHELNILKTLTRVC